MKTSYDKSTDSRYVGARAMPSCRTVEIQDDVLVDYGSDGAPVGYDIQHASTKAHFIARIILAKNASCVRIECIVTVI